MPISSGHRSTYVYALLIALLAIATYGCSRTEYRIQADQEAYGTIGERNGDPRWYAADYDIEMDPSSRYYDVYDLDRAPMPPDDPTSHQYMHLVNGMKGWKHWHDNGDRQELENPAWRESLAQYVEIGDDGSIKLDIDSALRLAYVHSPTHQTQLETLYLSALDVSAERFRLDTQFFGGYDAQYAHNGSLIPRQLTFSPLLRRFVIIPSINGDGVEQNRLTVGRPFGANPALQAQRRFATAGELLAGFANSFVFEFTGGDTNLSASLANFSLIQPLLRGAGRDIALEALTFEERKLLANLRAYGQFRQGLYTQVAIGELGVTGPQRGGSTTTLQSFGGAGGVNGYVGLLQQLQLIRNSEDNLSLQLRTLDRLEALYDNELIDLVQVDQFRQSIEAQRAGLLDQYNNLQLALDNFKTNTLGLPPSLPVELDESMINQFQLFPREANPLLESLFKLQHRIGDVAELVDLNVRTTQLLPRIGALPNDNDIEAIDRTLGRFSSLTEAVERRLDGLQTDIGKYEKLSDDEKSEFSDADKALIKLVQDRMKNGSAGMQSYLKAARMRLQRLSDGLTTETREATVNANLQFVTDLLNVGRGCVILQSNLRELDAEPKKMLDEAATFIEPVQKLFDIAEHDLARMETIVPVREKSMTDEERELYLKDRQRLRQRLTDLEKGEELSFEASVTRLKSLREGLTDDNRERTVRGATGWIQVFLQIVERLSLVPAHVRLELITVEPIDLGAPDAFKIALSNRLDFMNGRAALVDRWRLLQVNADALQSILNVTASGDIRTAKNNATSFRPSTGTFRMGLEFDAPFTRLLERNSYRESIITYQQNRRNFIQSRDFLERGLRALIRTLEQRRQQLEIQRRAVSIALRRVDQTQLSLNTPPPQVQPGTRAPINPTTAFNLLSAQNALQTSQNGFLLAWLRYYAAKLRLYRELGVMQLAPDGEWIESPLDEQHQFEPSEENGGEDLPIPPQFPEALIQAAIKLEKEESVNDGAPLELTEAPLTDDITATQSDIPEEDTWKPTKRVRKSKVRSATTMTPAASNVAP